MINTKTKELYENYLSELFDNSGINFYVNDTNSYYALNCNTGAFTSISNKITTLFKSKGINVLINDDTSIYKNNISITLFNDSIIENNKYYNTLLSKSIGYPHNIIGIKTLRGDVITNIKMSYRSYPILYHKKSTNSSYKCDKLLFNELNDSDYILKNQNESQYFIRLNISIIDDIIDDKTLKEQTLKSKHIGFSGNIIGISTEMLSRKGTITVVDINTRSKSYPILYRDENNKIFKCSVIHFKSMVGTTKLNRILALNKLL